MFKWLKINCDQATTICDKNQYGEATVWDKVKLMIHFVSCKICSLYTEQNNLLTSFYQGNAHQCQSQKHRLSIQDKEALKKKLKEADLT